MTDKTVLLIRFEDRDDGTTMVEVYGSGDEDSVGTLTMKTRDWEHLQTLLTYGNMGSVRAYMQMDRVEENLMPAIERATRPRRRWPWSRPSRSDTP